MRSALDLSIKTAYNSSSKQQAASSKQQDITIPFKVHLKSSHMCALPAARFIAPPGYLVRSLNAI